MSDIQEINPILSRIGELPFELQCELISKMSKPYDIIHLFELNTIDPDLIRSCVEIIEADVQQPAPAEFAVQFPNLAIAHNIITDYQGADIDRLVRLRKLIDLELIVPNIDLAIQFISSYTTFGSYRNISQMGPYRGSKQVRNLLQDHKFIFLIPTLNISTLEDHEEVESEMMTHFGIEGTNTLIVDGPSELSEKFIGMISNIVPSITTVAVDVRYNISTFLGYIPNNIKNYQIKIPSCLNKNNVDILESVHKNMMLTIFQSTQITTLSEVIYSPKNILDSSKELENKSQIGTTSTISCSIDSGKYRLNQKGVAYGRVLKSFPLRIDHIRIVDISLDPQYIENYLTIFPNVRVIKIMYIPTDEISFQEALRILVPLKQVRSIKIGYYTDSPPSDVSSLLSNSKIELINYDTL